MYSGIWEFKDIGIQEYRVFWNQEFNDLRKWGSRELGICALRELEIGISDLGVQGYVDIGIQRFKDLGFSVVWIWGFRDLEIQGLKDLKNQEIGDKGIQKLRDIWIK